MKEYYLSEINRCVLLTCLTKEAKKELTDDFLMECANINSSKPFFVRDYKAKFWLFDGNKLINLKTTNYVQAIETMRTRSVAE